MDWFFANIALVIAIFTLSCSPKSTEQQGSCIKSETVTASIDQGYSSALLVALGTGGKVTKRCQSLIIKQRDNSHFSFILPRRCLDLSKQERLAIEFPTETGAYSRVLIKSKPLERVYALQRVFPGGYPMPLIKSLQALQDSHEIAGFNSAHIQEERGLLGHPICSKDGMQKLKKHSGYKADCYNHFELVSFDVDLLLSEDDLTLIKASFKPADFDPDETQEWLSSLKASGSLLAEFTQLQFTQFFQAYCVEQKNEAMCNPARRLELEEILTSEDFYSGNRALLSLDAIPLQKRLRTELNQHFLDQARAWTNLMSAKGFSGKKLESYNPDVETGAIKVLPLTTDDEVEPIEFVFREYGILNLKGTPFGNEQRRDAIWAISGLPIFVHQDFSPANFVVKLVKEPLSYFESKIATQSPKETAPTNPSSPKDEPESYRKADPAEYESYQPNTVSTQGTETSPEVLPEKKNPCL